MSISDFPSHLFFALSDLIQKGHGIIRGDIVKIPITELSTEFGKNHFIGLNGIFLGIGSVVL